MFTPQIPDCCKNFPECRRRLVRSTWQLTIRSTNCLTSAIRNRCSIRFGIRSGNSVSNLPDSPRNKLVLADSDSEFVTIRVGFQRRRVPFALRRGLTRARRSWPELDPSRLEVDLSFRTWDYFDRSLPSFGNCSTLCDIWPIRFERRKSEKKRNSNWNNFTADILQWLRYK